MQSHLLLQNFSIPEFFLSLEAEVVKNLCIADTLQIRTLSTSDFPLYVVKFSLEQK